MHVFVCGMLGCGFVCGFAERGGRMSYSCNSFMVMNILTMPPCLVEFSQFI